MCWWCVGRRLAGRNLQVVAKMTQAITTVSIFNNRPGWKLGNHQKHK